MIRYFALHPTAANLLMAALLASGLLVALSPETFGRLLGGDDAEQPAPSEGEPPSEDADASPPPESAGDAAGVGASVGGGSTGGQPAGAETAGDTGDELVLDDDEGGEDSSDAGDGGRATPMTAEELVEQAERALAANHWRDPPEESMALALANLALVDPGHEALARLRRAAADELLPRGEKAMKRKQWTEASAAYRELVHVWPDHVEAREQLLEALHNEGKVLARHDEHERALAVADEILTMEPDDFRGVLMRADALYALGRYAEAKDAYAKAKKLNPRSKPAKKGWRSAATKAKKAGSG